MGVMLAAAMPLGAMNCGDPNHSIRMRIRM